MYLKSIVNGLGILIVGIIFIVIGFMALITDEAIFKGIIIVIFGFLIVITGIICMFGEAEKENKRIDKLADKYLK